MNKLPENLFGVLKSFPLQKLSRKFDMNWIERNLFVVGENCTNFQQIA